MRDTLVRVTYEVEVEEGERLRLPDRLAESIGRGRWLITIEPLEDAKEAEQPIRDHSSFLTSYSPEDEGLYDDYPAR